MYSSIYEKYMRLLTEKSHLFTNNKLVTYIYSNILNIPTIKVDEFYNLDCSDVEKDIKSNPYRYKIDTGVNYNYDYSGNSHKKDIHIYSNEDLYLLNKAAKLPNLSYKIIQPNDIDYNILFSKARMSQAKIDDDIRKMLYGEN